MHSYVCTYILYTCIIAYIHHCLLAFLIFLFDYSANLLASLLICFLELRTSLIYTSSLACFLDVLLLYWHPWFIVSLLYLLYWFVVYLVLCASFLPSFFVCFRLLASLCFVFVLLWMCFCILGSLYYFAIPY